MSIELGDIRNYAASRGVGTFLIHRARTPSNVFPDGRPLLWEARAFRSLGLDPFNSRVPSELVARTRGSTAGEALWNCLLYILVDLPKRDVELIDMPQVFFREGDDKIFISLDPHSDLPNMLRSRNFDQAPHRVDALLVELTAAETEALAEACFCGKAA